LCAKTAPGATKAIRWGAFSGLPGELIHRGLSTEFAKPKQKVVIGEITLISLKILHLVRSAKSRVPVNKV
jgi:hypothetical protein